MSGHDPAHSWAGEDHHPDRVPGAEDSIAPGDKFRQYLLDPEHSNGAPKARFFTSIGFTQENWEMLCDAIP